MRSGPRAYCDIFFIGSTKDPYKAAALVYFAVVYYRLRGVAVLSLSVGRVAAGARHALSATGWRTSCTPEPPQSFAGESAGSNGSEAKKPTASAAG